MVAHGPRAAAERGVITLRPFGAVALGLVVAVIGWLLIYVGGAWYSYELFTLYDGRNIVTPLAPRALVMATAAATSFVLLRSRLAAKTAAVLAMAGIAFSMFGGRLGGLLALEWDGPIGMGLWTDSPITASLRDLGYAISYSSWHVSILLVSGVWIAIAILQPSGRRIWRSAGMLAGTVAAAVLIVIVSRFAGPVLGEAMAYQPAARINSPAPALLALLVGALGALACVRWPTIALSVAGVAIVLLTGSLLAVALTDIAPSPSSEIPKAMWQVNIGATSRILALSAYSTGTLALTGAWLAIVAEWVMCRREASAHSV